MAQEPNSGNHDYAQLAKDTLHSIFSVEVTLRHQRKENQSKSKLEYYQRTALVDRELRKTPDEESKAEKRAGKRTATRRVQTEPKNPPGSSSSRNAGTRNSTGFAIATSEDGERLRILTCAHSMDECYAEHVDQVLTAEEANQFFQFEVTCSHQEQDIHKNLGNREISEQRRAKTKAFCIAIDVRKDLMVLEVHTNEICLGFISEEEDIVCGNQHPVIAMANANPPNLEPCILQGWPPQCMECYCVGHLSFSHRSYPAITELNPKGYTMRLADFRGMVALSGCSGGPVVTFSKQCLGVFHGVIGNVRGYAINAMEVIQFLERFDVLTHWPAVHADGDGDEVQQGQVVPAAGEDASGGAVGDEVQQGQVVPAAAEDASGGAAVEETSGAAGSAEVKEAVRQHKRRKKTVSTQPMQALTRKDGPAGEVTGLRKSIRTRKASSRVHGAEWE